MSNIPFSVALEHIRTTIAAGNLEDAAAGCQVLLYQFPESLEVKLLCARLCLAQGRLHEARIYFEEYLRIDPESVEMYLSYADLYLALHEYGTVLDCYHIAYELGTANFSILQKFNQLAVQMNQSTFILSQAGLARIYMRGSLLFAASQEWQSILAASPDRLDAKIGLLETLWLDQQYERTRKLAQLILQESPDCLKALLLLASVQFSSSEEASRQTIEHCMQLDPSLLMTRHLFISDNTAALDSKFLALLHVEEKVVYNFPDYLQTASYLVAESEATDEGVPPWLLTLLQNGDASPATVLPVNSDETVHIQSPSHVQEFPEWLRSLAVSEQGTSALPVHMPATASSVFPQTQNDRLPDASDDPMLISHMPTTHVSEDIISYSITPPDDSEHMGQDTTHIPVLKASQDVPTEQLSEEKVTLQTRNIADMPTTTLPDSSDSHILRASILLQQKDFDGAMDEFRLVVRESPEALDDVINALQKVLAGQPEYTPAYRLLGDAYMRIGEFILAHDAYNTALRLSKTSRIK